jgi:hypothetical protein
MRNELILIIRHLADPDYSREEIIEELMELLDRYFKAE